MKRFVALFVFLLLIQVAVASTINYSNTPSASAMAVYNDTIFILNSSYTVGGNNSIYSSTDGTNWTTYNWISSNKTYDWTISNSSYIVGNGGAGGYAVGTGGGGGDPANVPTETPTESSPPLSDTILNAVLFGGLIVLLIAAAGVIVALVLSLRTPAEEPAESDVPPDPAAEMIMTMAVPTQDNVPLQEYQGHQTRRYDLEE